MAEELTPAEFAELKSLCHLDWLKRRMNGYAESRATQCTGKHRFGTWELANRTIRGELRHVVSAYRCHICQGWHVGSREHTRGKRLMGLK